MADAIPVRGVKKAVEVADDVATVLVSDPLESIPEGLRAQAAKALAEGRTVTMSVKGNLKIAG